LEEFVMKTRPTGVAVIALFFILLGVFSLVWSGLVFGVGGLTSAVSGLFGAESINAAASSGMWSGFLGIFAAIVQIAVGIGLLGMKTWSWYLAVIAIGLSVIQGLVGMFGGGTFALLCGALWLLIPVGVLVYLARGSMRELFGVGR
jgi:hypothetical protein